MFAFLGSTVGKYIIIGMVLLALVGGAALYVKWTSDTIADLNKQVTALNIQAQSLKAANDAMAADIKNVQQSQDALNQQLNGIRVQSAQTAAKIRNQVLNTSNPQALQKQVNQDTSNAFKSLEDLTR